MLKNTSYRYGLISIILHWVMALSVFAMFGLGIYMVELSYYDSWYKSSLDLHKSGGIILALIFVFRIAWRSYSTPVSPADANATKVEKKAAHLVHGLLYLLLGLLFISGYLISTADGRGIDVLGLFSIPALPFSFENQEDIAGDVHFCLAWGLITLVCAHVLAALKHHFINHNNTLKRMLFVR